MALYLYEQPLEDFIFDSGDDDDIFGEDPFDYSLTSRSKYHSMDHPYNSFEKQLSKVFDQKDFELFDDISSDINIREDKNKYYIRAYLPGITKDQINIDISDDRILTISGEKESHYNNYNNRDQDYDSSEDYRYFNEEDESEMSEYDDPQYNNNNKKKKNKDNDYSMMECSYKQFEESINIPEDANLKTLKAKMRNGVLKIVTNKYKQRTPKNKSHNIQIQ